MKFYTGNGDVIGGKRRELAEEDFVRKAFEAFDVDKSGYIDPPELRAALTMLGVNPTMDALKEMGLEDKDGDGKLSLADLDTDGDQKIDYEEFKCFAAILPKREHAIYRNTLAYEKIALPRDPTKETDVMRCRREAQQETTNALNAALSRLRDKMHLNDDKMLMKDTVLLRKFQALDKSQDGRVDLKELQDYIRAENPEISKRDAWLIMNCADTNNDKHLTFDEFKRTMQTVARGCRD